MSYSYWPVFDTAVGSLTYERAQQRIVYAPTQTVSLLKLTADVSANLSLSGNATNSSGVLLSASTTQGVALLPTQFYDVPNTNALNIISTRSGLDAAAPQNSVGYLHRLDLAESSSLPADYVAATGLAVTPSKRVGPYKLFFMNTGSQIFAPRLVGAPNRVTSITITPQNGQLGISWVAPTANVAPITGYVIRAVGANGSVAASTTVAAPVTSCTLTGLSNGTAYTVYVVACSDLGYSVDSTGQSGSPAPTAPSAPTALSVEADNGSVYVSWSAPVSDGGATITGYRVTANPGNHVVQVNGDTYNATVSGLTNGTQYTIAVIAINSAGNGSAASTTATPQPTLPGSPSIVRVLLGDGTAHVRWTHGSNGGSALTAYTIQVVDTSISQTLAGTATSYLLTGLPNGAPFTIRLRATNAVGAGPILQYEVPAPIPVATRNSTFASAAAARLTGGGALNTFRETINVHRGSVIPYVSTLTGVNAGLFYAATSGATLTDKNVRFIVAANGESVVVDTSGMTASDILHIPGDAGESVTLDISGSGSYTVSFDSSGSLVYAGTTYDLGDQITLDRAYTVVGRGSAGLQPAPVEPVVPCFFGNARVLTPAGYRRMDSLAVGDRVMTPMGEEATIERIKITLCEAGPHTNPYVIPAGTFGATRRVLISPDHKVCLSDGRRVAAKRLGLVQEDREGSLTYYNIELAGQADMVVSGVAVESLAPVRRVVMSLAAFRAAVQARYGGLTPTVLANIKRTCRLVGPDAVEVPVVRHGSK
jgi:hypothetical protein